MLRVSWTWDVTLSSEAFSCRGHNGTPSTNRRQLRHAHISYSVVSIGTASRRLAKRVE
jgi:hypothetical protein